MTERGLKIRVSDLLANLRLTMLAPLSHASRWKSDSRCRASSQLVSQSVNARLVK